MDSETGLVYFRNRYYDPKQGRFTQRDPLGYVDGLGLHEAFGGRPGEVADPYGNRVLFLRQEGIDDKTWESRRQNFQSLLDRAFAKIAKIELELVRVKIRKAIDRGDGYTIWCYDVVEGVELKIVGTNITWGSPEKKAIAAEILDLLKRVIQNSKFVMIREMPDIPGMLDWGPQGPRASKQEIDGKKYWLVKLPIPSKYGPTISSNIGIYLPPWLVVVHELLGHILPWMEGREFGKEAIRVENLFRALNTMDERLSDDGHRLDLFDSDIEDK